MNPKILIVEDDVLISELLKEIVLKLNYNVIGIASNATKTYEILRDNTPDLILLDIQMHGVNQGIEIAEFLNSKQIPFIFISSFNDKSTLQSAIQHKPEGYILKPFSNNEIESELNRVFEQLESKYLFVKEGRTKVKLIIDDILFVKSDNVYLEIFITDKRYITRDKFELFLKRINRPNFIRSHRSYVVNTLKINSIENTKLLIGNTELPISKKYKDNLLNQFKL